MQARRWFITLFICLLIFFSLTGYKYLQIKEAIASDQSFPEPSASVEAIKVAKYFTDSYINTIGEIVVPHTVELRNELEGRITAVNFEPGGFVKKDDILLQFDISEESARLKAEQARVKLAKLELQRIKKLFNNNTVSEERVDRGQAEYDIAQANVRGLQATIDKKTLRSPFDAIAGLHEFDQGEFLQSNTHIVTLVGINDFVWVEFNVPLAQATIDIGSEIEITLPDQVAKKINAVIIAKNSTLSTASRNLRYRAKITTQEYLPSHAVVNIAIPTIQQEQIRIMTIAVLRDDLGTYVFILNPEKEGGGYRAQRQAVVIGSENKQFVSVLKGLKEGDLIASYGAFKLRHELLAYIKEPSSNSASNSQVMEP